MKGLILAKQAAYASVPRERLHGDVVSTLSPHGGSSELLKPLWSFSDGVFDRF